MKSLAGRGWNRATPSPFAVSWVLLIVASLYSMALLSLIPGLTHVDRALHKPPSAVNWALIATLLVGAVSTPLMGRVGDLVGHRVVLLFMIAGLGAGSLLGALAGSLPVLIAARVLQGLATALTPTAIALVRRGLPEHSRVRAIGLIAAGDAIGGCLGFLIGGASGGSWHVPFWISFGACVATVPVILAVVPQVPGTVTGSPQRLRDVIDLPGATLLSTALVAFLLPITQATLFQTLGQSLGTALVTALLTISYVPGTSISQLSGYTYSFIALAGCAALGVLCARVTRQSMPGRVPGVLDGGREP